MTTSQNVEEEKKLQYVSYGNISSFNLLDANDGFTSEIKDMLDGRLYYYDTSYIVNGRLRPELADGQPVLQEDNITYHITLKNGLKFSNGNSLTVDDIIFSYNVLMTPKFSENAGYFSSIFESNSSVYKVDESTVAFEINDEHKQDPVVFALGSIIERASYVDSYNNCILGIEEDCDWSKNYLISAGPYIFETYAKESNTIELVKNQYYHDPGYADRITISLLVPFESAIDMMNANEGDIFYDLYRFEPSDIPNINYTTTSVFEKLTEIGELNHNHPIYGTGVDVPDTGEITTNQVQAKLVRQAMSHAINRQEISANIWGIGAEPAFTFLVPGVLELVNIQDDNNFNITYAKELMESAGFDYSQIVDLNEDGDFADEGDTTFFEISALTANNSNAQRLEHVNQILNDFGKIGIGIKIHNISEIPTFNSRMYYGYYNNIDTPLYEEGGFDLAFASLSFGVPPEFRDAFSPNGLCGSGTMTACDNLNNYLNPSLENLALEYDDPQTVNERRIELISEIQNTLYEDVYQLGVVHGVRHAVHKSDILGLQPIAFTYGWQNWNDIYKESWIIEDVPEENPIINNIIIYTAVVVVVIIASYFVMGRFRP